MPRIREDWFEAEQLIRAASDGNLADVQRLYAAGFDLNLMDELSKAALHYAVENGHYKVAEWLLQNKAEVNLYDEEMIGETPLNLAARKDYPEMVELLLRRGANPDVAGWMGFTARIRAHARKDEDGLRIAALIEKYKPTPVAPLISSSAFLGCTMLESLLLFSVVAFIAIATPGPTVLLALTNGSRYGVRAALPGMFGAVLSDFVLVFAVALGLGALLAASELLFSIIKWIGVVYLAYLGLRLVRSKGVLATPTDAPDGIATPRAIFIRSFLVAVTNPKGYLFCSALLPQFVNTAEPVEQQYFAIGLVFASIDFLVMLAYAFAGVQAIRLLRDKGVLWLERLSGVALLALAGSLAVYRRQS